MTDKKIDDIEDGLSDYGGGICTLTKDHYYKFLRMFNAFKQLFGLTGWEVRTIFSEESGDAKASITVFDLSNHLAGLTVYNTWDTEINDHSLWRVAFHECMELLLAEMNCLAEARSWNYNEYDREGHRVIRTLESVLFDRMWGRNDPFFNIFQSSDKDSKRKR